MYDLTIFVYEGIIYCRNIAEMLVLWITYGGMQEKELLK